MPKVETAPPKNVTLKYWGLLTGFLELYRSESFPDIRVLATLAVGYLALTDYENREETSTLARENLFSRASETVEVFAGNTGLTRAQVIDELGVAVEEMAGKLKKDREGPFSNDAFQSVGLLVQALKDAEMPEAIKVRLLQTDNAVSIGSQTVQFVPRQFEVLQVFLEALEKARSQEKEKRKALTSADLQKVLKEKPSLDGVNVGREVNRLKQKFERAGLVFPIQTPGSGRMKEGEGRGYSLNPLYGEIERIERLVELKFTADLRSVQIDGITIELSIKQLSVLAAMLKILSGGEIKAEDLIKKLIEQKTYEASPESLPRFISSLLKRLGPNSPITSPRSRYGKFGLKKGFEITYPE